MLKRRAMTIGQMAADPRGILRCASATATVLSDGGRRVYSYNTTPFTPGGTFFFALLLSLIIYA